MALLLRPPCQLSNARWQTPVHLTLTPHQPRLPAFPPPRPSLHYLGQISYETLYIKMPDVVFTVTGRTTVHSSWLEDKLTSCCSLLFCAVHMCVRACVRACVFVPGRHEGCCDGT